MTMRKTASLVGLAFAISAASAAELTSDPSFVIIRPETSSFWHTATNSVMTVPVELPAGASSATLTVRGLGYSHVYENLSGGDFTFSLPEPTSPEKENVYDLELTFDNSVTRTAKLGLIQGLAAGGEGSTRYRGNSRNARSWEKVGDRAVLPIPYGTQTLEANGVSQDLGLDGAQGWYALGGIPAGDTTLIMQGWASDSDFFEWTAWLRGMTGSVIMFR